MNSDHQKSDRFAEVNNPGFNSLEFEGIRNEAGATVLSSQPRNGSI